MGAPGESFGVPGEHLCLILPLQKSATNELLNGPSRGVYALRF